MFSSATWAADVVEPSGPVAMAWRLDAISGATLGPSRPEPVWRQCIALIEAASRLNPQEPRFPRLRTLALTHLGDTNGAIAALKEYRNLAPADRIAQLELINLYASRMETLDAKVAYLSSLLDKQDIPPEVRAQVAVEITGLLAQKSPELAAQMAARAVQLYPLAQATRLYYGYVGRHEKELPKRVAALLAVVKADPNQPAYLHELAELLAVNGLADASLQWYDLAIFTIVRAGTPPPPGFHNLLVDYASQAAVAGRFSFADTIAGQMLDEQPLDADIWFLKLTVDKVTSPPQVFNQQVDLAQAALLRRWNAIGEQILNGQPATQPAAASARPSAVASDGKVEPRDVNTVLQKLKDGANPRSTEAVISVVSDLAWFYLYFDKKPDVASKWIEAIRPLLSAQSVAMQRLDGWRALDSGDLQKAREAFTKVADKDALSQFGLIRVDEAEKKPVDPARVTKLLDENRIGLVAAILWTALKTDATRPTTQPAANEAAKEIERFPRQWLAVLDPNSSAQVYTVRAEPVQTSLPFGAPVLAKVTLTNNGDTDITIGEDALLRRDLWFDARTLGVEQKTLPGVAFDQIENQLVLQAHHSTTQVVRLDSGALRQALGLSPGASTSVNCGLLTNPVTIREPNTNQEQVIAGPGGAAVNFHGAFTYVGVPLLLHSGKKQIDQALASGSEVEKMHAIDLLAAYYRLAQRPTADAALRAAATELPATIGRLRHDPSALVAAWANYIAAGIADAPEREKIVGEMVASTDSTARLLSLFAGNTLAGEQRKAFAATLSNDADPTVKAAAAATVELIEQAPATPASQPATAPAGTSP